MLSTNFLNTPKETNEIKRFFSDTGWEFKGNSISNALKRMPSLIEIRANPIKKNTNIYSKKADR